MEECELVYFIIGKSKRTRGGKSIVYECRVFVCKSDKAVSVEDVGLRVLSECLVLLSVRSGVGISRCDGSMVCSVEVMVCHMRGKARAGVPVVGSIASRSLMAEIKLLICKIGSRD
jgi:hypothetical protein